MGINLINNRLKLNNRYVFVISCTRRRDIWYFVELNDQMNRAVWTADIEHSHIFTEKASAMDFKAVYLSERVCTVLLIE